MGALPLPVSAGNPRELLDWGEAQAGMFSHGNEPPARLSFESNQRETRSKLRELLGISETTRSSRPGAGGSMSQHGPADEPCACLGKKLWDVCTNRNLDRQSHR